MTKIRDDQRAIERIKLELANRHVLILIHGLLLFEVGIAMALSGAPDFTDLYLGGGGARVALGLGAILPGMILIIGSWLSDEKVWGYALQVGGLLGVVAWHSLMATMYTIYGFDQGVHLLGPSDPHDGGRLYIPLIYLNILLLALIHLITLLRLRPPPR